MSDIREQLDRYTPLPMFVATLLFLVLLGIVLHVRDTSPATHVVVHYVRAIWMLYPLFLAELAVHLLVGSPRWRQHLLFCIVPPLRLAARDAVTGTRIWLPSSGWVEVSDKLEKRVMRVFSGPMILIALAMIPLLALEFIWGHIIRQNAVIEMVVDFGTAIIWAAFTVEFVVMVSIVKKRLRYCKEHWIDLAIILAPMLAFARLMRLGRIMRVQTLAKTTRVYRLRGLAMRAYQAIFLFEIVQKVFTTKPEKRLGKLQELLAEKKDEVCRIEEEIVQLETEIARRRQAARPADSARTETPRGGDATAAIVDEGAETAVLRPHAKNLGREPAEPALPEGSATPTE